MRKLEFEKIVNFLKFFKSIYKHFVLGIRDELHFRIHRDDTKIMFVAPFCENDNPQIAANDTKKWARV